MNLENLKIQPGKAWNLLTEVIYLEINYLLSDFPGAKNIHKKGNNLKQKQNSTQNNDSFSDKLCAM